MPSWSHIKEQESYKEIFEEMPPVSVKNIIEVAVIRERLKDSKKLLEMFLQICDLADETLQQRTI
jgi:hypothetical protein